MKKPWTALAVLVPVAYLIGRWKTPTTPIIVTPPDVHVHPPAPETEAPSGRYAKWRGGLDRNKVWLDPYVVALISAVAAGFAIVIAWTTNDINEKQSDLLAQQIAIEASRTLPVFQFERQIEYSDDDLISWIIMSNDGGSTRNVVLNVFHGLSVSWVTTEGRRASLWLGMDDLIIEYQSLHLDSAREGSAKVASRFPLKEYERASGRLIQGMKQGLGADGVYFVLHIYVSVEYQDYQGNSRTDYYSLMRSLDPESTMLDVIMWSEQSFLAEENQRRGNLRLPIGITDGQTFRAHIIAIVDAMKRKEEAQVEAPVASPVAFSNIGYWSPWREREHQRLGIVG